MAYTVHDTARVRDRIEADLATIQEAVQDADPHLRSLVLTGGFARGEGTVIDGQPQNDYDLVAIRGLRPPEEPYNGLVPDLEDTLGLHIDLAPVPAWRLPWVRASIFWYETRLRGRVLWGEDLLDRIPVQDPDELDPAEGLRLLVNRAAGLLLVTQEDPGPAYRIQAAKGLLAALDAQLLARGSFPPSQTERWEAYRDLQDDGAAPPRLTDAEPWLSWAYRFKTDPEDVDPRDPSQAWLAAADAILDAIPCALDHAGYASLAAYERDDGLLDHVHYQLNAAQVPQANRFILNPTGTVRATTLRILEDVRGGIDPSIATRARLEEIADVDGAPLDVLDALRRVTLQ